MIIKRSLFVTFLGLSVLFLGYFLTNAFEQTTKANMEVKPSVTEAIPTPPVTESTPKPSVTETAPKPALTESPPKPSVTETIPINDSIQLDVPLFNQRDLGYLSGCEIVSLGMVINYETDVDIQTLVSQIPLSNDPSEGFRGDVRASDGFTILPMALTELTEEYLGQAKDMSGCDIPDLKKQLSSNHPIVIWVNGLGFNVHAICLTGYNQDGFFYNDPWTGIKDAFISYDDFSTIWNDPIYDKHLGITYPVRLALSY